MKFNKEKKKTMYNKHLMNYVKGNLGKTYRKKDDINSIRYQLIGIGVDKGCKEVVLYEFIDPRSNSIELLHEIIFSNDRELGSSSHIACGTKSAVKKMLIEVKLKEER